MPVMTSAERELYSTLQAKHTTKLAAHDAENRAAVQTAKRIEALRESFRRGVALSAADTTTLFPTPLDARGKPRSF